MMTRPIYPNVAQEAVDGPASIGGVRSYVLPENGDKSYLRIHPTWTFASPIQLASP